MARLDPHSYCDDTQAATESFGLRARVDFATRTIQADVTLGFHAPASGPLDLDPMRPLAFSIVTNGDRPLSKGYVRKAHEQILDVICHYLNKSVKNTPVVLPPPPPAADPAHPTPDDLEEAEPDDALDAETAGQPAATP